MSADALSLEQLPAIPRDPDGSVFKEPWEAQAFGIAVHLVDGGYFTWAEWAEALARQVRAAQAAGDPDRGNTYYLHWLETLVVLCSTKGLVLPEGLSLRTEEWRAAYRRTPHGKPVQLEGVG